MTICEAVADYLESVGVKFNACYVGEQLKEWGGDTPQRVDAYRVSIGAFTTDYYMGLGNRKPVKNAPKNTARHGTIAYVEYQRAYLKPCAPSAADVLYWLLSDAQAGGMSFDDWCDELGYDADSIKALNIYQACCTMGRELRKVFNAEQRAHLSALLEDF